MTRPIAKEDTMKATAGATLLSADRATGSEPALLSVRGLTIDLEGETRQAGLVDDVSFSLRRGETLGLIGESGCGKSLTALSIVGLLPEQLRVVSGAIEFDGVDLLRNGERSLSTLRGGRIGTVFQDPMSSLNPTMTVGDQVAEARRLHLGESHAVAGREAVRLLDRVGIPDAARRSRSYPFELSGGMQQRVMIAAAISCDPDLIIADEPTTALDVTVQAEILDLFRELRQSLDLAVLMVTHDLGVVADFCDDVIVMYAGQIVDRAPVFDLYRRPLHPYTEALLSAVPRPEAAHRGLNTILGRVPPAGSFPTGCRFQPRCAYAVPDVCSLPQADVRLADGRSVRCCRAAAQELELQGVAS